MYVYMYFVSIDSADFRQTVTHADCWRLTNKAARLNVVRYRAAVLALTVDRDVNHRLHNVNYTCIITHNIIITFVLKYVVVSTL